jgi:hypothetical protein
MTDIYKQKAEKYKYKYLKLKQELYGGIGFFDNVDDDVDGCTTSPPVFFNPQKFYTLKENEEFDKLNNIILSNEDKLNNINLSSFDKILIKQDYPDNQTDINSFDNNLYIGKLINYDEYKLQLESLKDIKKISTINLVYTTGIKYAYTIHKIKQKKKRHPNELKKILSKCNIIGRPYNYGYIISDKPSESLTDLFSKELSPEDFNNLLNDLITAIQKFIIPLFNARYNLTNVSLDNIQWVGRRKICFDISALIKYELYPINNKEIKNLIICIGKLLNKIKKYNNNINYINTFNTLSTTGKFHNVFYYDIKFLNKLLISIDKDINYSIQIN